MGKGLGAFYVGGDTAPLLAITSAIQGQWVAPNITLPTAATQLYIGYASMTGGVGVARVNRSTLAVTKTVLATHEVDDHNVPAIIQANSGKMLTAYARHALESAVHTRLSASVDADDWGTVADLATSDAASYMQLHRLGARVWMLYRVGNASEGSWVMRYSDDEAATWSAERQLAPNTYLLSVPDPDGVHLRCFAYDHPVNGSDHDIYYWRVNLSTGDVINSAGTVLGNVLTDTGLPTTKGEQHKAVDVTDPTTTRLYEAGRLGVPALLSSEFTDENSGTYYRYTYASAATPFAREAIATSGPAFLASGSDYFGGACFDEADTDIVYVARNLRASVGVGSWELVKMRRSGSWERAEVIRTTPNIIGRPQVRHGRIFWSEMSRYAEYTDFTSAVMSRPI